MNHCRSCGVDVTEMHTSCPLCYEKINLKEPKKIAKRTYPVVQTKLKRNNSFKRRMSLFSVATALLCLTINVITNNSLSWSIISVNLILYAWTLNKFVRKKMYDSAQKIFQLTILCSIFMLIIDQVFGYSGWSISFTIPQLTIFSNSAVFILMTTKRVNYQKYIWYQLCMIMVSFFPLFFITLGLGSITLVIAISIGFSSLILISMFSLYYSDVTEELSRRFHI